MFIRRKVTNGTAYYGLAAKSYRENGEVKKRILISLGRCSAIQDAIRCTEDQLKHHLTTRHPLCARDPNKAEELLRKLEILRIVVTKSSQLQTVDTSFAENLRSVDLAVHS